MKVATYTALLWPIIFEKELFAMLCQILINKFTFSASEL